MDVISAEIERRYRREVVNGTPCITLGVRGVQSAEHICDSWPHVAKEVSQLEVDYNATTPTGDGEDHRILRTMADY